MRILVIGSGGREHALAWKLARSPEVSQVFIAPGNGGTAAVGQNVPIAATDISGLVSFARQEQIDLTVVGPEVSLVAGLVDAFNAAGLRAFGPTRAAARLEGSKAFAKQFMIEEGIPTAPATLFRDYAAAQAFLRQIVPPVVVKASGLAAGKGVIICPTMQEAEAALQQVMVERAFGEAGDECLIEDCLQGEEVSLLAFCDGKTIMPMIPARDYKRVGDGDQGPNTGGMGGYAPSPYLPPALVQEIMARVLAAGGGWDATARHALRRCALRRVDAHRPGAARARVQLPLWRSRDAVAHAAAGKRPGRNFLACMEGRLDQIPVRWSSDQAVCVVLASGGYPGDYASGKEIVGLEEAGSHSECRFPRRDEAQEGRLVTAGGRVLAVTCHRADLVPSARASLCRG